MQVHLTAENGVYNRDTGRTKLIGNVNVISSDGGKLTMDYAEWIADKEEVITDSHVVIEHSGIILEGDGARVLPKQKWAMLKNTIKAVDSNGRIITCDGPLEVDYEKKEAIFSNNVRVTEGETKLRADKMIAYFNPDTKAIERIQWVGDVEVVY